LAVVVVLPTPPLPDVTTITRFSEEWGSMASPFSEKRAGAGPRVLGPSRPAGEGAGQVRMDGACMPNNLGVLARGAARAQQGRPPASSPGAWLLQQADALAAACTRLARSPRHRCCADRRAGNRMAVQPCRRGYALSCHRLHGLRAARGSASCRLHKARQTVSSTACWSWAVGSGYWRMLGQPGTWWTGSTGARAGSRAGGRSTGIDLRHGSSGHPQSSQLACVWQQQRGWLGVGVECRSGGSCRAPAGPVPGWPYLCAAATPGNGSEHGTVCDAALQIALLASRRGSRARPAAARWDRAAD
jgi:hypothetical protein